MSEPSPHPTEVEPHRQVPVVWIATGVAVLVVIIVSAVLAIGLLGGSKRGDAAGLRDDVTAFVTVILSSEPPDRAYDHLALSCQSHVNSAEFEDAVAAARRDIEDELGVDLGRLAVAEVETRDVHDNEGQARVKLEEIGEDGLPVGDVFEATDWGDWLYQNGVWRAANCTHPGDLVTI